MNGSDGRSRLLTIMMISALLVSVWYLMYRPGMVETLGGTADAIKPDWVSYSIFR